MTKYSTVVFDIDNTLTDLSFVIDTIATFYHKPRVDIEDVLTFRLAEAFGLTDEEEADFWHTQEPKLIRSALLSTERVTAILDTYTDEDTVIYLVSNRPEKLETATRIWAEREGLPFDDVFCIGKQDKAEWIHSHLPETQAVFEDNPEFFENSDAFAFDTYCVDYPYNQMVNSTYRLCREKGCLIEGNSNSVYTKV